MLKFFRVPFAQSGTRTPIPDSADPSGYVSYAEGYGPDYQRIKTDPLSKNIERDKMNELFFEVTNELGMLQSQGIPDFITSALNGGGPFSYAKNALVRWTDGGLYISLVAANTATPADATKWARFDQSLVSQMADYAALRAYSGDALNVRVQAAGIAGFFQRSTTDTTTADNGGTCIVDAAGRRWFRIYVGGVHSKWFGAKGDGTTDDYARLQAWLNFVSATAFGATAGGGEALLDPGRYRITQGLLVGWGVSLKGVGTGGFPYTNPTALTSVLLADFGANVNQWVIDSATYSLPGGARIAHDAWVVGHEISSTYNPLHQVSISGIHIQAVDQTTNIIWGGVRLVGCPDSKIEAVTCIGTGVGFQMNVCFGGTIDNCHSETHFYGAILYDSNNGNRCHGYFNKIINPASLPVPVGRVPSWMPNATGMVSVFELDSSHYASAKGLVVSGSGGSGGDASQVLTASVILEYWPDAAFLMNSYSTVFEKLYAESTATNFVLTAAYASATCEAMNAACVNAKGFDVGYDGRVDATIQGLFQISALVNNISDNSATENGAYLVIRGYRPPSSVTGFNRLSFERRYAPGNYVIFDGATLAIQNQYNVATIERTAGEAVGDYFITFRRPSNAAALDGLPAPVASVSANTPLIPTIWWGGGDGITNNQVRVRVTNAGGSPANPQWVIVHLIG